MPDLPADPAASWRPATVMTHGGRLRSDFMETSEAIFMTSGYIYTSAEEAEHAFANDGARFVYSRYANPTVNMFEERLRLLEGAEACRSTASGMAAVFASLACFVKQGDRIVASRALFGSCLQILQQFLPRYGVETVMVDGRDLDAWKKALAPGCKAVFVESPSNPTLEIIDLARRRRDDPCGGRRRHRRQCVRDALAAKALEARRRHRRLFRDEAYRRPGPQPRRRGARLEEIHSAKT